MVARRPSNHWHVHPQIAVSTYYLWYLSLNYTAVGAGLTSEKPGNRKRLRRVSRQNSVRHGNHAFNASIKLDQVGYGCMIPYFGDRQRVINEPHGKRPTMKHDADGHSYFMVMRFGGGTSAASRSISSIGS